MILPCRTREETNFVRAEKPSQNSSIMLFESLKGSRWSSSVRAVGSNDSEHHLSRESLATVRSVRGEVKTFDGSAGTMQPCSLCIVSRVGEVTTTWWVRPGRLECVAFIQQPKCERGGCIAPAAVKRFHFAVRKKQTEGNVTFEFLSQAMHLNNVRLTSLWKP